MGTLDSLRAGGRTIGLISHVGAMKEQIPAKLSIQVAAGGLERDCSVDDDREKSRSDRATSNAAFAIRVRVAIGNHTLMPWGIHSGMSHVGSQDVYVLRFLGMAASLRRRCTGVS